MSKNNDNHQRYIKLKPPYYVLWIKCKLLRCLEKGEKKLKIRRDFHYPYSKIRLYIFQLNWINLCIFAFIYLQKLFSHSYLKCVYQWWKPLSQKERWDRNIILFNAIRKYYCLKCWITLDCRFVYILGDAFNIRRWSVSLNVVKCLTASKTEDTRDIFSPVFQV